MNVSGLWIVYNAWRRENPDSSDSDWISESAVEDEVARVADTLKALGLRPVIYPLSSVLDAVVRMAGTDKPGLIFNLAEGFRGNAALEMNVAALFEILGIPYTGNSARTLAAAQDKILAKRLFSSAGIPTPPWSIYDGVNFPDLEELAFPLIVKPSREDASLGICKDGVFTGPNALKKALARLYGKYRQPILIENFIDGREINAAILETGGVPRVLPLSEISFEGIPKGDPKITSYEAKWHSGSVHFIGTPTICPALIDPGEASKIGKLALRVFTLMGGKDYGRVDFRLDAAGNPQVLEYNPNPDISPSGGFARSLEASGTGYRDFILALMRNNRPDFKEIFLQ